ncbi:MAG: hypothetical protein ACRC62_08915 [Microcoleus sp.]
MQLAYIRKSEGRRKARHGFGHGYTDELFRVSHTLSKEEGRGKKE